MNIFVREIKANLRSLLIWGGIVVLLLIAEITEFSAYHGNPDMLAILDSMPPALLEAFQFNAFNLTTLTGFFGVMFTFLALLAAISAAMWGSDIISKEERDKTVEFALSLPITREKLVTGKILAAMVNCIGLLLIMWGTSLAAAAQYEPDSAFYEFLSLIMVALFIMQMVFLAVGIFLGCALKDYKRSGSIAVSVILGTYFFSVISGLNENLEFLKYFTPFKYFDPAVMLHESRIDLNYVWLSLGIIVVCLVGGYVTYARRDMYI
jgi:ABC-2 type transport system permease protein